MVSNLFLDFLSVSKLAKYLLALLGSYMRPINLMIIKLTFIVQKYFSNGYRKGKKIESTCISHFTISNHRVEFYHQNRIKTLSIFVLMAIFRWYIFHSFPPSIILFTRIPFINSTFFPFIGFMLHIYENRMAFEVIQ